MKRLFLFIIAITCLLVANSQDFFDSDFNKNKNYVLLTNPTVETVKTIQYLMDNRLLRLNKRKVKLVGVYFEGEDYDFTKTKRYIEKHGLKNIFLQEITGDLNENNLFEHNACSDQLRKAFDNSIGVFFFGGPDIPPGVYGEENTLSEVTDPERHFFEATFLFHLLGGSQNTTYRAFLNDNPNYLVTGFCLGMQTMNVATGGTLIQDIPYELYGAEGAEATLKIGQANLHRNYWQEISDDSLLMGINLHTIRFTENPFFGKTIKLAKQMEPRVVSSHHQAAEKLGLGMEVTAVSPDGKIVEALAHKHYPNVFAVQFHPELPGIYKDLYLRKFQPNDEPQSYHDLIGKQSLKFHKKYWLHISHVLRKEKQLSAF